MQVIQTKMRYTAVMMDPEEAQRRIDRLHPKQRRPKPAKIKQYLLDARAGNWELSWDPIAVDEDNYTVNGQNRLIAIVQFGSPLPVVLCTGVPSTAMAVSDMGTPRTVADVATILGKPFPHGAAIYGGAVRRMAIGLEAYSNKLSIPATLEFADKHKKALEFAFELINFNKRGVRAAPVLAVLARAYYRKGARERLKEFAGILRSGLPENPKQDSAAVRLLDFLVDNAGGRRRRQSGAQLPARLIYARTEAALDKFLAKEFVQSLRETDAELFPIPDEYTEEDQDNG